MPTQPVLYLSIYMETFLGDNNWIFHCFLDPTLVVNSSNENTYIFALHLLLFFKLGGTVVVKPNS